MLHASDNALFDGDYPRSEWMPLFSSRKVSDDCHVLTSPTGKWLLVSGEQFKEIQGVSMSPDLLEKLEERCLVLTSRNAKHVFDAYQGWKETSYTGTSLHIIVATKRCNLHCIYCHASSTAEVPSKSLDLCSRTARRIVEFIFESPSDMIRIEFQGGESLLNFNTLREMVKYAREMNASERRQLEFSVVTNLTVLTKEHCEFFRDNNINISTSFDGLPNLHNHHRPMHGGRGSFLDWQNALIMLRDEGLSAPGILSVFSAESLPHYREIVDMFIHLGLTCININFVQPLGRASEHWDSLGVTPEEHLATYRQMLDYIFERFRNGDFIAERYLTMALHKLLVGKDVGFMDFRNPCGIAIGQMAYGVDGTIFTCDEGRSANGYEIGNVWADSYAKVVNTPKVHRLLSESLPNYPACSGCAYAPYCAICPVINHARMERGYLSPNDPGCAFSRAVYDYAFQQIAKDWDLVNAYMMNANLSSFTKVE